MYNKQASSLLATHTPKIVSNITLPLPLRYYSIFKALIINPSLSFRVIAIRAAALFLQGLVLMKYNQLAEAKYLFSRLFFNFSFLLILYLNAD